MIEIALVTIKIFLYLDEAYQYQSCQSNLLVLALIIKSLLGISDQSFSRFFEERVNISPQFFLALFTAEASFVKNVFACSYFFHWINRLQTS